MIYQSIGSRDIVDTRICHADADAENLSLRPPVTLKMESPNLNQLFGLSQCCIHASLVKFHPLIQEIWYIQTVTPTPMPMPRIRTETILSPSPLVLTNWYWLRSKHIGFDPKIMCY